MDQANFNSIDRNRAADCQQGDIVDNLSLDDDLKAEDVLSQRTNSPIGKLLGQIAQLPQVRHQKVLSVRRQLSKGDYELNDRLDSALDSILEDLIIQ